jgi:prepilin-type N-terminal cleavage/methylation domain-containing protein
MGAALAISARRRRDSVWRRDGESNRQSKDVDFCCGKWKRSVALKHYVVSGRKMRQMKPAKISGGFSLIELMMAMAVLAVGLLGGIMVIAVAAANDGRSKLHSTAATMASSVMEKIQAIPAQAAATQTSLTDCGNNTFTIETAPGGADLISGGAFAGAIDFSKAPLANYSMLYVMCSSGTNITYDVRWRIDAGPTRSTQTVTVSAKPVTVGQFALPSTMHASRGLR